MDTFETVKTAIKKQLNVREDMIVPKAKFVEDLGADSLDIVALIMYVEERFGVEIPEEEMEGIVRVADLVNYLEKRFSAF